MSLITYLVTITHSASFQSFSLHYRASSPAAVWSTVRFLGMGGTSCMGTGHLGVVSNFSHGNRGAGEMHARAREISRSGT